MRKIFRNIFISALALSAAVSCVDDRNNFMVDDSFGFNNAIDENVTELAIYGGTYELAVIKSGKGFSDATVFVGGSNAALIEYNEEKGTNYIEAVWSEWVNPEYAPTVSIMYNEVFI